MAVPAVPATHCTIESIPTELNRRNPNHTLRQKARKGAAEAPPSGALPPAWSHACGHSPGLLVREQDCG